MDRSNDGEGCILELSDQIHAIGEQLSTVLLVLPAEDDDVRTSREQGRVALDHHGASVALLRLADGVPQAGYLPLVEKLSWRVGSGCDGHTVGHLKRHMAHGSSSSERSAATSGGHISAGSVPALPR